MARHFLHSIASWYGGYCVGMALFYGSGEVRIGIPIEMDPKSDVQGRVGAGGGRYLQAID